MEQLNRMNRPAPAGGQVPSPAPMPTGGQAPKQNKSKVGVGKIIGLVAVVVVTIIVIAALFGFLYKNTQGISAKIQDDKYQAVFLNSADGQVYFGKLADLNSEYYELTDIYYVRVEQVQPNPNEEPQQNISLAKLGNEIHGPEDAMFVRKDHVMFWENLKDDGQVVTAITEYKQNGGNTDNTQTQQDATPAPTENTEEQTDN